MPLIEWKDSFAVGVASVDYEHKQLIELLNQLDAVIDQTPEKDAVAAFLGEIYSRISAHFALEEKLMREQRYDQYQDHKSDHERLLDDIREIMERHEADAYYDYREALAKDLAEWFGNHFRTKDARLHRTLR